jgi:hypothetical protein
VRLASEIFLTSLQTAFFNNLLEASRLGSQKKSKLPALQPVIKRCLCVMAMVDC